MKHPALFIIKKPKLGRPATGQGHPLGQRWHRADIAHIDRWRRQQPDTPTRAEAIRRLVELGLKRSETMNET